MAPGRGPGCDRAGVTAPGAAVTCDGCGAGADEPALTWSRETLPQGERWLCEQCTRQHVRAIEGRLDPGWW